MKYKHNIKKTDEYFLINILTNTRDKTPLKVCSPCNLGKIILRQNSKISTKSDIFLNYSKTHSRNVQKREPGNESNYEWFCSLCVCCDS